MKHFKYDMYIKLVTIKLEITAEFNLLNIELKYWKVESEHFK